MSFGSGNTASIPQVNQAALGIGPTQLSTNQQARPVPVLYGKARLGVTFLSDAFDASFEARIQDVKSGDSTIIGYSYFAKFAFLIGHGPVDVIDGIYLDTNTFINTGRLTRDKVANRVCYITVTQVGENYESNKFVGEGLTTFQENTPITLRPKAGDPGTGARARAVVHDGRLTHIAVTSQGSGYLQAPDVIIKGNGSNAKATAFIGTESYRDITVRVPTLDNLGHDVIWRLYWGTETQDFDPDLLTLAADLDMRLPSPNNGVNGGPRNYDNSPQDHPAYIGQCYVVAKGTFATGRPGNDEDLIRGMPMGYQKTGVPNIEVVAGRYPGAFYLDPVSSNVGDDINMAVCVSDALMNKRYGMGVSFTRLSGDEFFQVAAALNGYNFEGAPVGISAVISRQEDFKAILIRLLENFDAYYTVTADGLFAIGLAREISYCASPNFVELDETCLTEPPTLNPESWSKTFNFVYVKFTNRDKNFNDDASPASDMGNFQITGEPQTLTLDRPWITQQLLADAVAKNAAYINGIPRTQGTLHVRKSKLQGLKVGDGIKLSWNHYNMCRLYGRVNEITIDDPYQPVATVVFEVDRGYVIDGGYTYQATPPPPAGSAPEPTPATNELVFELPFTKAKGEKPYVGFLFRWPVSVTSYVPWLNDGNLRALMPGSSPAFYGTLAASIGLTEEQISVTIDGDSQTTQQLPQITPEQGANNSILLIIGDEVMSVHSPNWSDPASNTWTMSAIRERFDTKRFNHSAGEPCYIVYQGGFFAQSVVTGKSDIAGDSETFRIQTVSAGAALDIALADDFSYTFLGRAKRPWKPRNLQVNGVLFYEPANTSQYSAGGNLVVQWDPLNREDGSRNFEPGFIANLWQIEIRRQSDPDPIYPDPAPICAISSSAAGSQLTVANNILIDGAGLNGPALKVIQNLGEVPLVLRIFARDGSGNVSLNYDEILIDKV